VIKRIVLKGALVLGKAVLNFDELLKSKPA
jgi:hypothetical protein